MKAQEVIITPCTCMPAFPSCVFKRDFTVNAENASGPCLSSTRRLWFGST